MFKYAAIAALFCVFSLGAFGQQPHLLVAQKGDASVGIIDPASGKVIASVPVGGVTVHEVAASPDGRFAYAPIYGNSGVGKPGTDGNKLVVIDIAQRKIVGQVDFSRGVRPHFPLIGPRDGMLYVTTELDHSVTVVDPKALKITGRIPTAQPQSHMLALAQNGRRGYTANVSPGTVSVLDIPGRKTVAVIPISSNTQRISITPDDRWVFTADQTQPRLAVIDTLTDKIARWIPLEDVAFGTAPALNDHFLLVTLPDKNRIAVVDLKTMQTVHNIDVPAYPQEILMRPDGKVAYVSCMHADKIAEIDLTSWKLTRTIETGKTPDGLAWAK